MTNLTQEELFVSLFCDQLAKFEKGARDMRSFYVLQDKRPRSLEDRFRADAEQYFDYERMTKP